MQQDGQSEEAYLMTLLSKSIIGAAFIFATPLAASGASQDHVGHHDSAQSVSGDTTQTSEPTIEKVVRERRIVERTTNDSKDNQSTIDKGCPNKITETLVETGVITDPKGKQQFTITRCADEPMTTAEKIVALQKLRDNIVSKKFANRGRVKSEAENAAFVAAIDARLAELKQAPSE